MLKKVERQLAEIMTFHKKYDDKKKNEAKQKLVEEEKKAFE